MRYLLTITLLSIATPCFAVNTKTYTVCESGCDYTTVQAAESAHDQHLVDNDSALTFEIQNTWSSDDGQWIVDGSTTDATRFFTITAVGAARAGATYDGTNAYRTVHATAPVQTLEDYTVIDGIQSHCTETGGNTGRAISTSVSINYIIKNCFLKGASGSSLSGIEGNSTTSTVAIVRNNVVMDFPEFGIIVNEGTAGVKVDNNTVENCGVGILTGSGDAIARNNIIWNCTTPISGNFYEFTFSEENYTDASSLNYGLDCGSCGAGDQLSQSDPFESLAGEDYHLASGAAAIDAGKDLSGAFTDAIGGKTRDANFDKGADEFIAAAGSKKVMIRK